MSKIINSISLKNYRGFNEECLLYLADSNNICFLVGPNNSGKSLIARVLSVFTIDNIHQFTEQFNVNDYFCDNDFHALDTDKAIVMKFNINTKVFEEFQDPDLISLLNLDEIGLCFEIRKINGNFLCCMYLANKDDYSHQFNESKMRFEFKQRNSLLDQLGLVKDQIEALICKLFQEIKRRILVFDSIRSFDRVESSFYKNGSDLINWINERKHPGEITRATKQVCEWLKEYFNLDEPSAIRADISKKQLIFTFEDMEFSSQEVGTGYTMLYILLIEIIRSKKDLIIIDEIESHLQPGLVRLLINLIRNHGESQYIIATHSAPVMETAKGEDILYRFNKKDGMCKFENFFRREGEGALALRELCNDLGVIPGDALLCNVVVWVEGPSEMFWIRSWLKHYLPLYKKKNHKVGNLIEGLHYTILMTGGSNISHLSFNEDEIPIEHIEEDNLLKVLKVNPNPFVIVDSDNASHTSKKFLRLLRIAAELNKVNLLNTKIKDTHISEEITKDNYSEVTNLWVLKGKELENYCHPQLIKDFYTGRASYSVSKIKGVQECLEWDVFSDTQGTGEILKSRGITNISKASGTIIHKNELARFVFNNLNEIHFQEKPKGILSPNTDMLEDLKLNLDKMLGYIFEINDIS